MYRGSRRIFLTVFVAIWAVGMMSGARGLPAATTGESGCIVCHTDEKTLVQNLSKEKPEKSALTSGAG